VPGRDRRVLSLRFRRVSFLFRVARGKSARSRVAKRPTPCLRRARPAIRQLGPHMIRARPWWPGTTRFDASDGDTRLVAPSPFHTDSISMIGKPVGSWPIAEVRSGPRAIVAQGRRPGARSPAHARGAPSSVRRRCAINTVGACDGCGHREWCLCPCPKPPARAPGWHAKAWYATPDASGRWWCPRAQARFAAAPHGCRAERC